MAGSVAYWWTVLSFKLYPFPAIFSLFLHIIPSISSIVGSWISIASILQTYLPWIFVCPLPPFNPPNDKSIIYPNLLLTCLPFSCRSLSYPRFRLTGCPSFRPIFKAFGSGVRVNSRLASERRNYGATKVSDAARPPIISVHYINAGVKCDDLSNGLNGARMWMTRQLCQLRGQE